MADDGYPDLLLADLVQRVPGARAAVLLSSDGMAMCERGLGADDVGLMATAVAGVFSHARQAAVLSSGMEGLRRVVMETDSLLLFAASAGASAVLVVTAGRETDAGELGAAISKALKSMQPFLATRPWMRARWPGSREPGETPSANLLD